MSDSKSKPITPTEAALIVVYLLIALARQVTRDVRTVLRWLDLR